MWLGTIAMSMVFLNRYLGLLSLAQVTIAGVAAYGVGYFAVTSGWPDSAAMIVAVVIGTAFGAIIALISVRTQRSTSS